MATLNPLKRVDIRVGYKCNNRCIFCAVGEDRNLYPEMSKEQIMKLVDKAKKKGADDLTITGGEPTIRKDLIEIIRYINQSGFRTIMLTTNGRMLYYESFCKSIIKAGVNKIMISLHASDKKLYEKITSVDGFDNVVKGIRNVINFKVPLVISFVMTKYNYNILPEFARFISNIGTIDALQITYVKSKYEYRNFRDNNLDLNIMPRLIDCVPILKECLDLKNELKIGNFILMEFPLCFITGYENYYNESTITNMLIYEQGSKLRMVDYNKNRVESKIKLEFCKECIYTSLCEGIRPRYVDLYGFEEFKPIRKLQKNMKNIYKLYNFENAAK